MHEVRDLTWGLFGYYSVTLQNPVRDLSWGLFGWSIVRSSKSNVT